MTGNSREEAPYSPQYILRPEKGVSAVLAFGVVPLTSRDAEAHALGSGGVGRTAGGGDEAESGNKSDGDEVVFVCE